MRDRVAGVIVVGAVVLAYAAALPGTFHYDDGPTILRNPSALDAGNLGRFFVDPDLFSGIEGNRMYRPVLLVSYVVNYRLAGFDPFLWHLTNVLLHAVNALLVLLLTRRLLPVLRPGRPAGLIPLLAGLGFALHPVHSEVVNYISSRSGAISTLGFLGALILHLSWTRRGRTPGRRASLLAGSLLLLLVGYGGKEIAAAFVPVVFCLELLDPANGPLRKRITTAFVRMAPALLVTIGYLYLRKQFLGGTVGVNVGDRLFQVGGKVDLNWGGGRTIFENLITQARVFWLYVGLLLFPKDLAVDRFVRVSTSIFEPAVIVSLIGIGVVVVVLLLAARRAPLVSLCGAIFLFGLAPTSTVIPLNVVMNEHRLYLPGVGIAILAALPLAALLLRWPKRGAALIGAILCSFVVIVFTRSRAWQDPMKLWSESVRVSPRSFRSHNEIGSLHLAKARQVGPVPEALPLLEKSRASFAEAERLYPTWFSAHLNLGIVHRERAVITGLDSDFEESLAEFERCATLSKNKWRARLEIAATYAVWRKYDEAFRRYEEMAEEDREDPESPRNPLYLRPMARISMDRGDHPRAAALYREITKTRKKDLDAWLGLARAIEKDGRQEEAVEILRGLLSQEKDNPQVHLTCAKFFAGLEPPQQPAARAHFERAIRLGHRPTPEEFDRYLK